ncbi:hypothetical protein MKX03_017955 [Papaver bracteatum]|nr:hypothetical protein MKX03_017955 [Papaver bracteatum]
MDTNQHCSDGVETTTTQSLQNSADVENSFKLFVEVDASCRPIKKNAEKLASHIGELILEHCPICYEDWRIVPENFKEDVWNGLMFKSFKYHLRQNYFRIAKRKAHIEAAIEAG